MHGLSGVPTTFQYLREEIGLAGHAWESLGKEWQSIAKLWLRTELILIKAARSDLSFNEIRLSDIPEEWKDWMSGKLMNSDASRPAESFGSKFTKYLKGLPPSVRRTGGTVMEQVWCRSGKTGTVGLLLCLFWQAEYSGAGNEWKENIKCIQEIFQAILSEPNL